MSPKSVKSRVSRSARLAAYLKANKEKFAAAGVGLAGLGGLGFLGYKNRDKIHDKVKNLAILDRFRKTPKTV